jgi:hypothetical protein
VLQAEEEPRGRLQASRRQEQVWSGPGINGITEQQGEWCCQFERRQRAFKVQRLGRNFSSIKPVTFQQNQQLER